MFGNRYWAGRYFPDRYFPPGGAAAPSIVAQTPPGLSGGYHEKKAKNRNLGYEESIGTKYDVLLPEPARKPKKRRKTLTSKINQIAADNEEIRYIQQEIAEMRQMLEDGKISKDRSDELLRYIQRYERHIQQKLDDDAMAMLLLMM